MGINLNDIGLRNKVDQASNKHNYLHKYESLLAGRNINTLAIILGTRPVATANTFAEFLPDTTITAVCFAPVTPSDVTRMRSNVRIHLAKNLGSVRDTLVTFGPYDVLIEDSPNRKSLKREIFRQLFPVVRAGGLYIAEDLHASYIPSLMDDEKEDLWQVVSRLLVLKASGGKEPSNASEDDLNLSKAVSRVEFDGKFLVIESSGDKLMKLRHAETNRILQTRYGSTWGEPLSHLEATEISSNALVSANKPATAEKKFPNPISVPDLYVRQYNNVVALPNQILLKDSFLLPDTFRLALTKRLKNTALEQLNHNFAWSAEGTSEPEHLAGQYYYLDIEYKRHFGHFMTEVIPRLYGWDSAKAKNPELKALITSPTPEEHLLPYQLDILNAYGLGNDDIHTFNAPVRVDSLISAMPLFHNGRYVHPILKETFLHLGKNLRGNTTSGTRRLFVSRKPGMWRECLNMTDLESLFVARGFEVIYPEKHSLREQAKMFSEASVVAGYIGSSLYSAMFNENPINIIGFVNTSYQSTNEYFIATALGHSMHMFWCDDIKGNREIDSGGRRLATTNYDFEFNFERDGESLIRILDNLD